MKKVLFIVVALLAMSTVSYGLIIGNFEQELKRWSPEGGSTLGYSPIGATLGLSSLSIQPGSNQTSPQWVVRCNSYGPTVWNLGLYDTLSLDVTFKAAEWVSYANFGGIMSISSDSPSGKFVDFRPTDDMNAGSPGSWDPAWGDQTHHLTYDISSYKGMDATWISLCFKMEFKFGDAPGKFYIDNVQLSNSGAPSSLKDQIKPVSGKSTAMTLSAGNLLENGGFETGICGWGVNFETFNYKLPEVDTRSSWVVDSNKKAEGDYSLRVDMRHSPGLLAASTPGAKIMSEYFQALAETKVTFSLNAKASRTSLKRATLVIAYYPQTFKFGSPQGPPVVKKEVKLDTTWKRYSLTVDLPKSKNDAYAAGFIIESGSEDASVWMDAACVSRGSNSEYSPNAEIELGGNTGDRNNLYEPGTAVPISVNVRNNRDVPVALTLESTVLGPGYQLVSRKQTVINISPATTIMEIYSVTSKLRGAFRVYLTASDANGKELASHRFSYGLLEDSEPVAPNPESRFGVNTNFSPSFEQSLKLAQRCGFKWVRHMMSLQWRLFEASPGEWDVSFEKQSLALVDLYSNYGLTPLARVGRGMPRWAAPRSSAAPYEDKMDAYGDYLKRIATTFTGKVLAYEVWNEPDSRQWYTGTPEQYASLLKTAHTSIKSADPEALVVGFGLQRFDTSREFCDAVLNISGLDCFDVLNWHPYRMGGTSPGPEEGKVREEFQLVQSLYGQKQLWNTEFGWKIPSKFALPFTPYANQGPEDYSEEDQGRFFVQQITTAFAHGVTKIFYFNLDEGSMTNRWAFGIVGRNSEYLKAAYFSAAALIRNTDFADSFSQEKCLDDLYVTRVIRNEKEKLVVWKASGAVDIQIETRHAIVFEDIYGNPFTLHPVDGKVYLTVNETPLYVMCPRSEITITKADFGLNSHSENAKLGISTLSMQIDGNVPDKLTGEIQSGMLQVNSSAGMDVVPDEKTIVGETYETLLWLRDETGLEVGRLISEITVTSND